ncbi:hypothetical protein NMK71_06580 [Weeksellaceae bacterium KMM 9713]|uniref:Uncharacterized protein n=1 Tax=Profundicola chukchiensis TaxID=2961959 RepID=A0A9X4N336_9FLAO|nr:hypothetical protein [Profundicola chukchiensis]MDG4946074.1 hypothetical protein [Profundicola chukchiensis]
MQFLKTILLSVFIGFYFLSITPIHFYAHSLDHQESTKNALDDCTYINLLSFGQGNFLNPESVELSNSLGEEFISREIIETKNKLVSSYLAFHFNLRAPPYLNCTYQIS